MRSPSGGQIGLQRLGALVAALLLPLGAAAAPIAGHDTLAATDLRGLSLEDLANIEITSVTRQAEPLSDAPAAVYVITNEDIRRSGQTSLPEILRLAPNLEVAQINANSYAITARGFNSSTANKLLVLIDGRSVYTPLFSGVFWDMQDVVPDDIDRIEVISGPGGTLWGANAVNGVINIITKHSRDTQGGLVTLGGGNVKYDGTARYGGRVDANTTYRLYGKGFAYQHSDNAIGARVRDAWSKPQGGFRIDWDRAADAVTLQGDAYQGSEQQALPSDGTISGYNLLGRWIRSFGGGSALQLQAYYDQAERSFPGSFNDWVATWDFDLQHSFAPARGHEVVWGGGYRLWNDHFTASPGLIFLPPQRSLSMGSVFAQDTIALADRLKLILGARLESNGYTGLQPVPSARLSWKIVDSALLWTAVSRAVRTPSRIDRDFFVPGLVAGGPDFRDEKLTAYEIGYRQQLSARGSVSISTFYNVYDDLRSLEAPPGARFPLVFSNKMEGDSYGVELWGNYSLTDWWRLSAGFNALHESLRFKPGSNDVAGLQAAGNDPHHQFSLRSSMNLTDRIELDLGLREVGRLPNPPVPSYVSLDARIGWHMLDSIELSLTATNLLDDRHPEFGTFPTRTLVGRTVFAALRGRY
jgi:iron complex outermembrane receptor protein